MSFWDNAKKVGIAVGSSIVDDLTRRGEKVEKWEEIYRNMSKEKLAKERENLEKHYNMEKYMAFKKVCEERGYYG